MAQGDEPLGNGPRGGVPVTDSMRFLDRMADRMGRQPPAARLLVFGLALIGLVLVLSPFVPTEISMAVLATSVCFGALYVVLVRSSRDPLTGDKLEHDRVYRRYASAAGRADS